MKIKSKIIEWEEPWNQLFIDLSAIKSNYNYLCSMLPKGAVFYAVLKSDAYGHGLTQVCNALADAGCKHFAVDSALEAIQIRKHGFSGEILLLNPIPEWMCEMAVYYDLSVSIIHESILEPLELAAKKNEKKCKTHLALNVGLNRLGISPLRLMRTARQTISKPHLILEGLYAQPRDPANAREGFQRISRIYKEMKQKQIAPEFIHFSNSTTFLSFPEMAGSGLRIGILIYGVLPPEQANSNVKIHKLKPAMSLRSKVVQVRGLSKGDKIGYRSKDILKRNSIIATLPIGYGHGISRKLVNGGFVLIKGRKAPFIGAISMNNSTVDVTDIPNVSVNDRVTIIGRQGKSRITFNQLASAAGTISAELMLNLGSNIARRYISHQKSSPSDFHSIDNQKFKLFHTYTEKELPSWVSIVDIVKFLRDNMELFEDSNDVVHRALNYALSTDYYGDGFVLLMTRNKSIAGLLVCIRTGTAGFIPENIIVYACINRKFRNIGLGKELIKQAVSLCKGNIKLHVDKENPAIDFYRKQGFSDKYFEMRYLGGKK